MPEAYLIDAARTAVGRREGALSTTHPADLAAHVLRALVERNGLDPSLVDDVILGCVDAVGPQTGDLARTAWLATGLSVEVPGVTIDRQCGSSQQAVHFAAQAVMSGTMDLVLAGGVQNMSQIPLAASGYWAMDRGFGDPFTTSKGWQARWPDQLPDQFAAAERIAERWDISREAMEEYALESHRRAVRAVAEGRFSREIVAYDGFAVDEGPRKNASLHKMSALDPLVDGGRITPALASQISDGAAALLVASERAVKEHGLRPRARVHHMTVRGDDPIWMLTAPIPATRRALARAGMRLDDVDHVEINEAFASVVLAWQRGLGAVRARVNPNGGAIALGHPIGATGARLMTTMLHELERTGGRFGLQTMCEGGGQANVTILERLD
jgi:acetyl-CoA C-acetyltransferase